MSDTKENKPADPLFTSYGPWAVVAGASEGLGAAYADELAARQFNLVLIARNAEKLSDLGKDLTRQYGIQVKGLVHDLSKQEELEKINAETADLDIGLLVYNAAYAPSGPFLDLSAQKHEQVLATNCRGPLLLTYFFAGRMRTRYENKQLRSGILLMSSLAGFQGSPYLTHYAASKAYNIILAEGLREEFAGLGIDVLVCVAGAIATPGYIKHSQAGQHKDPWAMKPEKVASIALRNLGKQPLVIPGFLYKLSSFFMRHFLSRHIAVLIMKGVAGDLLK